MELGAHGAWRALPEAAARAVILLDTNALIWLLQRHRRARVLDAHPLLRGTPACVHELQLLIEVGRLTLAAGRTLDDVVADPRWTLDEPRSGAWFARAAEVSWTRDPFDRLIVAHAQVRGWKLATGDAALLDRLRPGERLPI